MRFAENKNSHLAENVVIFIFSWLPGAFVTPGSSKHGESAKVGVNLRFWRKFSKKYSSFSCWRICIWLSAWKLVVQKHNSEKLFCPTEHGVVSVTWRFILCDFILWAIFQFFVIHMPNRKDFATIHKMLNNWSTDISFKSLMQFIHKTPIQFICNLSLLSSTLLLYRWKIAINHFLCHSMHQLPYCLTGLYSIHLLVQNFKPSGLNFFIFAGYFSRANNPTSYCHIQDQCRSS